MDHQVSIVLKSGDRYNIHLTDADVAEFDKSSGRFYIGDLFSEEGLEAPNPIGKILLIDQILLLAQERKPAAWAQPDAALKKFLAAVVQSLGRSTVTIDLVNYKL